MSDSAAIKGLGSYLTSSFREFAISRGLSQEIINGYAALKAERDALAAENLALKDLQPTNAMISAAHQELEDYDNVHLDDDVIVFMWQAMRGNQPTPATDAYLNSVRAEGVESLANILQVMIDAGDFVGDEVGAITGAIDAGNYHAAQLRAGEPS